MGVQKYVSVTPFLLVEGTIKRTRLEVERRCSKHPKIDQGKSKFCSECGKEIVNKDTAVVYEVDGMQVLHDKEEFEDQLFQPEYCDAILPNHTVPNALDADSDGDATVVDLLGREILINKQVEWFKTKYAKEIAYLKKEFGEKKVVVCWGVVSYWS